jgi:molecular chaperone GrpE
VHPLQAEGTEFDPSVHEAVGRQVTTPEHDGEVVVERRRGYRLHGRLLRPAQVVVGRAT